MNTPLQGWFLNKSLTNGVATEAMLTIKETIWLSHSQAENLFRELKKVVGYIDAGILTESLGQVREMAWFWQQNYNLNRTHESLGHLPPETCRKQLENSNQECLR